MHIILIPLLAAASLMIFFWSDISRRLKDDRFEKFLKSRRKAIKEVEKLQEMVGHISAELSLAKSELKELDNSNPDTNRKEKGMVAMMIDIFENELECIEKKQIEILENIDQ